MTLLNTNTQPNPKTPKAPYRVVVGSDLSELGDRVVFEAFRLCGEHPGAALHVITVGLEAPTGILLPGPVRVVPMAEARETVRARVAGSVQQFIASGQRLGLDKIAIHVLAGDSPAERMVALATAIDADVILIGTHGRRGLERLFLGSVAEEVVKRAACNVFVFRPREFLDGERVPEVQPPLKAGEHALLPFRESAVYHYVDRVAEPTARIMPAL